LTNRNISPYIPRNELHFVFYRKTSTYFTLAGYSIKDILFERKGNEGKKWFRDKISLNHFGVKYTVNLVVK
jgi:hypothetical protein